MAGEFEYRITDTNRQFASNLLKEIANGVAPELEGKGSSPTNTTKAIIALGAISRDPADLPFLQQYFANLDAQIGGKAPHPFQKYITDGGASEASKLDKTLTNVADVAMRAYTQLARNTQQDDQAVPALANVVNRYKQGSLASTAYRCLSELYSASAVKALAGRMRADEPRLPVPWRPEPGPGEGSYEPFSALWIARVLAEMTHPDAEPELRGFVRRSAARYANDPNREQALSTLLKAMPPPVREEATANNTERPMPADGLPNDNAKASPNVVTTPTTEATHELAPATSEWTFAAIAAGCLVLLGGLVFFWKRRPS